MDLGTLCSTFLKEPFEILALESKAAPIAELGGRNDALSRPIPQRLDVHL
jgi:hypothetical protein